MRDDDRMEAVDRAFFGKGGPVGAALALLGVGYIIYQLFF